MSVKYRRTAVLRMLASEERRRVEKASLEDIELDRERVALPTSEETEETVEGTEEVTDETDEVIDETDEVTDETDEENVSHSAVTEYHGGVCLDEDQFTPTTKLNGWHIP